MTSQAGDRASAVGRDRPERGGGIGALREVEEGAMVQMLSTPGTMVCELSFFYGVRAEATVEAVKSTTCLLLDKSSFEKVKEQFPNDCHKVRKRIIPSPLTTPYSTAVRLRPGSPSAACPPLQVRKRVLEQAQQRATTEMELTHLEQISKAQAVPLMQLMSAAAAGDEQSVREVVKASKLDPNLTNPFARTCLHAAAAHGHAHVVEALIALGADPKQRDMHGEGPLELAARHSHEAACRALRAFLLPEVARKEMAVREKVDGSVEMSGRRLLEFVPQFECGPMEMKTHTF